MISNPQDRLKDASREPRPVGEQGSTLVLVLLLLGLVSVLGVSATITSSMELQISGNDKLYKENLCRAEAAAMESAQRIKNEETLALRKRTLVWLNPKGAADMKVPSNWDDSNSAASGIETGMKYAAVDEGIERGASLDLGSSTVRRFAVYGRAERGNGLAMIKIGFRKRF